MKTAAFLVFFTTLYLCYADDHLLGPPCGQQRCSIHNYCDKQTYHCDDCRKICSPDHNFDQLKCISECQVFFFDQRYYEKDNESSDTIQSLNSLKVKFNVAIVLIVILIIGYILLLIMSLKQQKKISFKNIRAAFKKQNDNNKSNGVSKNTQGDHIDKKIDLKIEIPDSTIQSESPTTVTTGVSRIPAEDSIVYAYDNPAMSNSPKSKTRVI